MLVLFLVVLFLVLPFAELFVIVQVAQGVGIPETIGLLVLVAVVGSWLCKREGMSVLRRVRESLDRYELPQDELVDGGLVLFAGVLLVTPGFLTDLLGILLLLPPSRAVFRRLAIRGWQRRRARNLGGARLVTPVIDTTDRPWRE